MLNIGEQDRSPAIAVRQQLTAARAHGQPFEPAWTAALEAATPRWRDALTETQEAWRKAFERSGRGPCHGLWDE